MQLMKPFAKGNSRRTSSREEMILRRISMPAARHWVCNLLRVSVCRFRDGYGVTEEWSA